MLGLIALGLTSIMIYTLVKNALLGKQLSKDDQFKGNIELIIPVTPTTEFFLEAWQKSISTFQLGSGQLKVHVLIDGHHASLNDWQELRKNIPYLEIHSFPMRPTHVDPIPWMLDQMAPKIQAAIWYLENGGKEAVITNPENIGRALKGETGTHIVN